jgi:hypothetical protein
MNDEMTMFMIVRSVLYRDLEIVLAVVNIIHEARKTIITNNSARQNALINVILQPMKKAR